MTNQQSITPIPRPILLRLLSALSLLLPTIFYIIALALALNAIYSPDFARADRLTTGSPENSGQLTNHTQHASPFYTCAPDINNSTDPNFFSESCHRRPFLGAAGMQACLADTQFIQHICEKVTSAASLYVAGAVLIGLALLFDLIFAGLSFRSAIAPTTTPIAYAPLKPEGQDSTSHPDLAQQPPGPTTASILIPFLGSVATLLAILSVGCLILGQILGVDALVVESSASIAEPPGDASRWYMGKASLVYTSTAYVAAILGIFTAASGCGVLGR
jgi:hypothetical protein